MTMELFTVNRYAGEEQENKTCPNETELRKKLLQKIRERKKFIKTQVRKKKVEDDSEKKAKSLELDSKELVNDGFQKLKKFKKEKEKPFESKLHDSLLFENHINNEDKKEETINDINEKTTLQDSTNFIINNDNVLDEIDNSKENIREQTAFTILKDAHMCKKERVKRKLPDWLANPSVVSVDLKNLTCPLHSIPELDKIFVDKLKENGITHFFPVQNQVIPSILQNERRPHMFWPNDICVSAPTGSGKTLAFVLPILQVLHKRIVPRIRALVVLPVQDLANQVFKVFQTYGKSTDLNIVLLSKTRSFEEEQKLIRKNDGLGNYQILVDIIVTTPGRLVEHLTKTKGLCLVDLKYLVIDEADRVMENVQNDWLYHLNKHINSECTRAYQVPIITYNNMINRKRPPNKLLFSATLSQDPEKLQHLGLFHPKLYTSVVKSGEGQKDDVQDESKFIGKYTTPAELKEYFTVSSKRNKPLLLHYLMHNRGWKKILCFVNSTIATFKLAFVLKKLSKKKMKISQLSADLPIKERTLILQKFYKGKIDLLISSDALARGIDIPKVRYVISYDCPKFVKTYVHRIGRTGRAGKEGTSLIFLTAKEVNSFKKMISSAGKSSLEQLVVEEKELEQYEGGFVKTLTLLANYLEKKKVQSLKKIKSMKKLQTLAEKGKFVSKKKNKRNKIDSSGGDYH